MSSALISYAFSSCYQLEGSPGTTLIYMGSTALKIMDYTITSSGSYQGTAVATGNYRSLAFPSGPTYYLGLNSSRILHKMNKSNNAQTGSYNLGNASSSFGAMHPVSSTNYVGITHATNGYMIDHTNMTLKYTTSLAYYIQDFKEVDGTYFVGIENTSYINYFSFKACPAN